MAVFSTANSVARGCVMVRTRQFAIFTFAVLTLAEASGADLADKRGQEGGVVSQSDTFNGRPLPPLGSLQYRLKESKRWDRNGLTYLRVRIDPVVPGAVGDEAGAILLHSVQLNSRSVAYWWNEKDKSQKGCGPKNAIVVDESPNTLEDLCVTVQQWTRAKDGLIAAQIHVADMPRGRAYYRVEQFWGVKAFGLTYQDVIRERSELNGILQRQMRALNKANARNPEMRAFDGVPSVADYLMALRARKSPPAAAVVSGNRSGSEAEEMAPTGAGGRNKASISEEAPAVARSSLENKLLELKNLLDGGVITQDEYSQLKKRALGL